MMKKLSILTAVFGASLAASAQSIDSIGSTRYATDAYPGFDSEKNIISPSKKEPKWFSWINGPNRDNAREQFEYCEGLEKEGDFKKAAKHYDALVREWPTTEEAAKAQLRLAQILDKELGEHEEAFKEYRYLADFFSLRSDYNATVDEMYRLAGVMRMEGKTVIFFRFKNTVDVRRAFETCVLRAPGAKWAPAAMLEIGDLREEEEDYTEAVKVYENLRNLHYGTAEARTAVAREARARMRLVKDYGYNHDRCRDTAAFMKQALTLCAAADTDEIRGYLSECEALLDDEAYEALKFYDSRTRTRRSAISAYERYLSEYPNGVHAEDAKARLEALRGESK